MRAYMRAFILADMHARVQLLTGWREARGARREVRGEIARFVLRVSRVAYCVCFCARLAIHCAINFPFSHIFFLSAFFGNVSFKTMRFNTDCNSTNTMRVFVFY